jgi:hypothetical protein
VGISRAQQMAQGHCFGVRGALIGVEVIGQHAGYCMLVLAFARVIRLDKRFGYPQIFGEAHMISIACAGPVRKISWVEMLVPESLRNEILGGGRLLGFPFFGRPKPLGQHDEFGPAGRAPHWARGAIRHIHHFAATEAHV